MAKARNRNNDEEPLVPLSVQDTALEMEDLSHWPSTHSSIRPADLPDFDRAFLTRKFCVAGIVVTYILSFGCIAAGSYLSWFDRKSFRTTRIPIYMTSRIVIDFKVVVSICTECLGYVHSVSLRWALHRERKLGYNSNLRLFANARHCAVNSWYANTASVIGLVLSYAAASQILLHESANLDYTTVNHTALLVMGMSLLLQVLLTHACLWGESCRILTWSSNPLTVTLACLKAGSDSSIAYRPGRCMLSAAEACISLPGPEQPRAAQPSLRTTDRDTRHIVRFAWGLSPLTLLWASIVFAVQLRLAAYHGFHEITIPLGRPFPHDGGSGPGFGIHLKHTSLIYIFGILLVAGSQTLATLALHSVELLVNRSRDEFLWRRAASFSRTHLTIGWRKPGALKRYDSTIAAWSSWQSIILFILKPVVHWLFGSSLTVELFNGYAVACMFKGHILFLSGLFLCLAIFTTILSRSQPSGYIPSTWGHLQTLADLVDDWGDGDADRLYWGDKGIQEDGTRHAGTAGNIEGLGEIHVGCTYRGR